MDVRVNAVTSGAGATCVRIGDEAGLSSAVAADGVGRPVALQAAAAAMVTVPMNPGGRVT